jgi:hypothetical protein
MVSRSDEHHTAKASPLEADEAAIILCGWDKISRTVDDKPVEPQDESQPPKAVPWYKYKYSLLDWATFAFFIVLIFLIVKSCAGV